MISNLVSVIIISWFINWHSVLQVAMPLWTGHHNYRYSRSKTRTEGFIFCITFCQSVSTLSILSTKMQRNFVLTNKLRIPKTIEVEPAGKASFHHICIQTRLLGQYKGNWPFSLVYQSRPLITALQLFLVALSLLTNCKSPTKFSTKKKLPCCPPRRCYIRCKIRFTKNSKNSIKYNNYRLINWHQSFCLLSTINAFERPQRGDVGIVGKNKATNKEARTRAEILPLMVNILM